MKIKGPIVTLAAGVLLAAVLLIINIRTTNEQHNQAAPGPVSSATSRPAATATTSAPPVEAPAPAPVTYAGSVGGGGATIAIAVKDGKAIAYLCDGATAEAWLQGSAGGGSLQLSGAGAAALTGTYANGSATGTVTAVGRQWTFTIATVAPPSGLYRANANVAGAQVVAGWIVLADGTQVGTSRTGPAVAPAPALNVTNATAVLNGATVTAVAIDGTTLN